MRVETKAPEHTIIEADDTCVTIERKGLRNLANRGGLVGATCSSFSCDSAEFVCNANALSVNSVKLLLNFSPLFIIRMCLIRKQSAIQTRTPLFIKVAFSGASVELIVSIDNF